MLNEIKYLQLYLVCEAHCQLPMQHTPVSHHSIDRHKNNKIKAPIAMVPARTMSYRRVCVCEDEEIYRFLILICCCDYKTTAAIVAATGTCNVHYLVARTNRLRMKINRWCVWRFQSRTNVYYGTHEIISWKSVFDVFRVRSISIGVANDVRNEWCVHTSIPEWYETKDEK